MSDKTSDISKRSLPINLPDLFKIKLSIYVSSSFNIWQSFKERYILIDKGILTILSVYHLKEKGMFHLSGMKLTNDSLNMSIYPSNLQLCLMPVEKSADYSKVDKTISHFIINTTKNQPIYPIYLLFQSEQDKSMAYDMISQHILYSNMLYNVNAIELYKDINLSSQITSQTLNYLPNYPSITPFNNQTNILPSNPPNDYSTDQSSYLPNDLTSNQSNQTPYQLCGYLLKRGHYITNWRMRYFILSNGMLSYYYGKEKDSYIGVGLKGTVHLYNYMISLTIKPGIIYLSTDITQLPPNTKPYIFLITSTIDQAYPSIYRDFLNPDLSDEILSSYSVRKYNKIWSKALYRHILYGRYIVNLHRQTNQINIKNHTDSLDCLIDIEMDNQIVNGIDKNLDSTLNSNQVSIGNENKIDNNVDVVQEEEDNDEIIYEVDDIIHSDLSSSINSDEFEDALSRQNSTAPDISR